MICKITIITGVKAIEPDVTQTDSAIAVANNLIPNACVHEFVPHIAAKYTNEFTIIKFRGHLDKKY